jgi:hypothetical protein
VGCQRGNPGVGPKDAAVKSAATYTLRILFHGLIAYVPDPGSGKFWALLVNASYDPSTVQATDLPPGMYDELMKVPAPARLGWLHNRVPPHRPQLRFHDADVTGAARFTGNPGLGDKIQGADLTFTTGQSTLGTLQLDGIANSAILLQVRPDLQSQAPDLAKLDKVDATLLANGALDKRLAARALVTAGTVTAKFVNACGGVISYGFMRSGETVCGKNPQPLAEEVMVEQTGIAGPVTVDLGSGEKVQVSPHDGAPLVEIEVVNQTDDQIASPCVFDCQEDSHHTQAYRWFYRLVDSTGQAALDKHFFPCVFNGTLGPPICPNKVMTP